MCEALCRGSYEEAWNLACFFKGPGACNVLLPLPLNDEENTDLFFHGPPCNVLRVISKTRDRGGGEDFAQRAMHTSRWWHLYLYSYGIQFSCYLQNTQNSLNDDVSKMEKNKFEKYKWVSLKRNNNSKWNLKNNNPIRNLALIFTRPHYHICPF